MYLKIIAPLCILGFLFASCNNGGNTTTTKLQEVPVVNIESQSLTLPQFYASEIHAVRNVELHSKISGFLDGIFVDEGQYVKKGQILFKIGDNEFRFEVEKARAVLNSLKAEAKITEVEYNRVKTMVEKKIIGQSELDLAYSKLKSAEAKAQEAESAVQHAIHRLSYTTIRAPFDGVIDRIPLKTGSLLDEGTLITTVSDISTMYAYFNISENEYLALSRDTDDNSMNEQKTASLVLSDGQQYPHSGHIETVVSEFNGNTGSISVRASFPNPEHLLKHKASGKVKLVEKTTASITVPQKATFEIQDKNYVFVLDANNVVKMKSFVPAGRTGDLYIVASGLKEGERVVYEGIQNIKEGMKVAPVSMPANTTIKTALK